MSKLVICNSIDVNNRFNKNQLFFWLEKQLSDAKIESNATIKRYKQIIRNIDVTDFDALKLWADNLEVAQFRFNTIREIDSKDLVKELDKVYLTTPVEITEEVFDEMLDILPPISMGTDYFVLSEFITLNYTIKFYRKDNKYYYKGIDYKRKETWNHDYLPT